MPKIKNRDTLISIALVMPSIVAVGIFVYGFILWSLRVSLSQWKGLLPDYTWVGLKNYFELFADPRSTHTGEWFFNGLRFSDNQYITGTFDPTADDPSATLTTEADITGQIETLVIVPNL